MGLTYFKRYRMEIDLTRPLFAPTELTVRYCLIPWHESLVAEHAETKYRSFCTELDSNVFPCLGDREGCRRLMEEISAREGFLSEATWLLKNEELSAGKQYCGTIQGVRDNSGYGSIQNVGVIPEQRGRGLGSVLIHAALQGFQEVGLRRAYLEVTAQNTGAIRLYQRLGFRRVKTVYKTADIAFA